MPWVSTPSKPVGLAYIEAPGTPVHLATVAVCQQSLGIKYQMVIGTGHSAAPAALMLVPCNVQRCPEYSWSS